jgi:hypothetical protein
LLDFNAGKSIEVMPPAKEWDARPHYCRDTLREAIDHLDSDHSDPRLDSEVMFN